MGIFAEQFYFGPFQMDSYKHEIPHDCTNVINYKIS